MPIMDAPLLAKTAFLVGKGDVFFATGRNPETGIHDTFLIAISVEGEIGGTEETGREGDAKEAGLERNKTQSKPAEVALRFTSRKSLESFVLEANELLGLARADKPLGNQLIELDGGAD